MKFPNIRSLSEGHIDPRHSSEVLIFICICAFRIPAAFLLSNACLLPGGLGNFHWYKVKCCRIWMFYSKKVV